jgi:hypothetical protein
MDLQRRWIKLKKEIIKATSDLEENMKHIRALMDREEEEKRIAKHKRDIQK